MAISSSDADLDALRKQEATEWRSTSGTLMDRDQAAMEWHSKSRCAQGKRATDWRFVQDLFSQGSGSHGLASFNKACTNTEQGARDLALVLHTGQYHMDQAARDWRFSNGQTFSQEQLFPKEKFVSREQLFSENQLGNREPRIGVLFLSFNIVLSALTYLLFSLSL